MIPDPGLDEVVAVHGRGDLHLREPRAHELEEGHLGRRVLHGHPIDPELGVGVAPFEGLALGIGQVVEEDLLGQRDGPAQPPAGERDGAFRCRIAAEDEVERGARFLRR